MLFLFLNVIKMINPKIKIVDKWTFDLEIKNNDIVITDRVIDFVIEDLFTDYTQCPIAFVYQEGEVVENELLTVHENGIANDDSLAKIKNSVSNALDEYEASKVIDGYELQIDRINENIIMFLKVVKNNKTEDVQMLIV